MAKGKTNKRTQQKEYPLTVWLTESLWEELTEYCEKYDIGKSQFGRHAIRNALEK